MRLRVQFAIVFALGTIFRDVQCYPTVDFGGRMQENDIADISSRASTRRGPFLAEVLDPRGNTVLGVYLQGFRRQIEVTVPRRGSRAGTVYRNRNRAFRPRAPFRMLLKYRNNHLEIKMVNDQLTTLAEYKYNLRGRTVGSVVMRGSYLGGRIRKAQWTDYMCKPTDCGRRLISKPVRSGMCPKPRPRHSRIIGGDNALAGEHPWQVSIWQFDRSRNKHSHICGAVLIDNCWALSAAHCFPQAGTPTAYRARVGDYYNQEGKGNRQFSTYEQSQDVAIEKIFAHGGFWTTPSTRNDIALIRLRQGADGTCVRLGEFVQPVCLPESEEQFRAGTECVIAGWGAAKISRGTYKYPPCLQQARVEIIGNDACKRTNKGYGDVEGEARILETMFCATGTGGSATDTCQGDSGGPLVCSPSVSTSASSSTPAVLWGITSWGDGCGTHYGVYTRVASFRSWMDEIMLKYCHRDPFSP